jgi:hypothetical protein
MRQSLAQFERAFHFEAQQDEQRRRQLEAQVAARARARFRHRANKRSSLRFYVAMLATLYLLLT